MPAPSTERVLKRIKEVYHQTGRKDADLKPTLSQYASVINTWTKCSRYELKAAPRTEKFLHELEQLSITDDFYKPTVEIYTTVIKAYTHSKHAQKPQLALRILQDMETRYKETKGEGIRPTLRTYHGVMNACAMCTHTGDQKDRTEALRIAFQLLKVMRASGVHEPNFVTYGTLIKATKNLVPPSETQDQIFRNVFAQCKRDGQVEGVIINQLRSWTSDPLFRELTERVPIRIGKRYYKNPNSNSAKLRNRGGYDGGNNSDNGGNNGWEDVMKDIPTEWKRNVLPLKE
uniref:Pentacotripeptide-repeat region of PRORP domain-containing protein n=1 Tax=Proboscia inermis TaxID=420281 RepID=A0A7S0BVY7_9STRA